MIVEYEQRSKSGELMFSNVQLSIVKDFESFLKHRRFRWFDDVKYKGIYLYGYVGNGKTMISDMFCMHFKGQIKRFHSSEFSSFIYKNIDLAKKNPKNINVENFITKKLGRIDILFIDDFEIRDIVMSIMAKKVLINLVKKKVKLIFTSNIAPNNLYPNGLNRSDFEDFIHFINDKMLVKEISLDEDFRLNNTVLGNLIYFNGKNDIIELHNNIFSSTVKTNHNNSIVDINGYKINVILKNDMSCIINFDDICNANFGQGEYLDLVEKFDHIFIDEIYQMTKYEMDIARRFIILIDAIYDKQKRFYGSFKVDYRNTIIEYRHSNEVDRCVSRLEFFNRAS
jgi:cell division protein ZapE